MWKSSENKQKFFKTHSIKVSKTLKEPLFQKYLHKIIKKENIKIDKIRDIQIKTFPFQKENGKSLAGKCNNKGIIHLYTKKVNFYKKLGQSQKEDSKFLHQL